ncbi:hypothetical protein [Pontibacter kalidii]|uniref:hypothetical protein n=1 Tax=Pontibacter kalidii TaxID=2592049 RepID=UPI00224F218D|nr:hypothetical protein [Pontibacter kalidii]
MTDATLYILIGSLIIAIGSLIVYSSLKTVVTKRENPFSRSAKYQFTILGIGLIVIGLVTIGANI